jgi:hypothetical protein
MAVQNNNEVTGWTGWVYFAGLLMILRGLSGAFLGLTALVNKQYLLVSGPNAVVLATANVQAWGWVHLALGVLVLAAGFSVMHGSRWARVLAVVFASAAFLANLAFIAVFPIWAVVAMVVDVLVIYALVVHGNEVQ